MATARLPDLNFEVMTAEDVLRWAAEEFGDKLCLTCSWQRQSSVLIHMLSELALDVDIVELDTMVLFPETYETRDRLVERYGPRRGASSGASGTACGRSSRSSTGTRSASRPTSTSTRSRTTRFTTRGTRRSGASRAHGP